MNKNALIISLVILFLFVLVAFGSIFFASNKAQSVSDKSFNKEIQNINETSDSTEVEDIQKDLDQTNIDNIDSEMSLIETELEI